MIQNFTPDREPTKHFRFLKLPAEIRNTIYGYIIDGFERKAKIASRQGRCATSIKSIFAQLPRSIRNFLLACKEVRCGLLSLVFRSYTWTADLRLDIRRPGQIKIFPEGSWALIPSTALHPISDNIRHVKLRMKNTFSRSTTNYIKNQCAQVTVEIQLVEGHYIAAVTSGVWTHSPVDRLHSPDRSDTLRQMFESSIDTTLQVLIKSKLESKESVTSLTVEEWRGLIMHLESTYFAWVAKGQT